MYRNKLMIGLTTTMVLGAALAVATTSGAQSPGPGQTPERTAIASTATESQASPQPDTRQAMIDPYRIITPGNGDNDLVAAGQKIFNGTCSHCHGPDAVQSVRRLDLRQLRHRYGDTTATVFQDTVAKGRPSKGMPSWSKVLTDDKFQQLYAYLSTIQTE
jgi:mono/diheme cytochrome c family protein